MKKIVSVLKSVVKTKKKFLGLGLVILLLTGWFFLGRSTKKDPPKLVAAKRQTVQELVSTSGQLNGKNTVNLKFKISGKLAFNNVALNDSVSSGQVVSGLDTQDLQIALREAQNTYQAKQATAQNIEDQVKGHSSDETFSQRDTRTAAQTARDSAFDAVRAAQRAFQDAQITSPINGTVTQLNFLPGQVVGPTDTIIQVVDFSAVYFDADVDEADIGKVALGQRATISLNAYPDRTFYGVVDQINPETKTTSSGATVVTVRTKLETAGINLIPGLNGQINIIAAEKQNVLAVPNEALREDNTVITRTGSGFVAKKVTLGIKSDSLTEITSGLNEGDQVVTNPLVVNLGQGSSGSFNPLNRLFRGSGLRIRGG